MKGIPMTIRVGIDASGPSKAALRWATERAIQRSEPVELVHVVDDEWGQRGRQYTEDEEVEGTRVLASAFEFAVAALPSALLTSRLAHGSMAYALSEAAADGDTVVVGTHKTGYLRGRVIGTRSIVVASTAPCDVVVVPDVSLAARHGVVVGVAAGPHWPVAAVAGARAAAQLEQGLILVHAAPEGDSSDSLARQLLDSAAARVSAEEPAVAVRSRVSRRRAADALLDASHDACLLVMGTSRHSADRFIGSVIHDVLLNINAPVLVARNSDEV